MLHLPYDRLAVEVRKLHAMRRDDSHISIRQEENVASVMENRRNVRRYKILVIA